jgi:hypothetical protein
MKNKLLLLMLAVGCGPQDLDEVPDALADVEGGLAPTDRVLRVYNNNMENLVTYLGGGKCDRVSAAEHIASMLVDADGKKGSGAKAPDLLILQQLRGQSQADAYADALTAKFGLPANTYKAVVAWAEPEEWGGDHKCNDEDLGALKKRQTNGLIYNSKRLKIAAGDLTSYWSAGRLNPGARFKSDGSNCELYKPPHADSGANTHKWKRTSAIAARFTIVGTSTKVFAATMHLPEENFENPCAGEGDTGLRASGIHLSAEARGKLVGTTIRVVGIDANRRRLATHTMDAYGMTGFGKKDTHGFAHPEKIDYLFIDGTVLPSKIDHTVGGTKSNHMALYGFIKF